MTQAELEQKQYDSKEYIANKFKDIQILSQTLVIPEGYEWKTTVQKIQDAASDILRETRVLENLENEYPD
jgi:hypothetical protein